MMDNIRALLNNKVLENVPAQTVSFNHVQICLFDDLLYCRVNYGPWKPKASLYLNDIKDYYPTNYPLPNIDTKKDKIIQSLITTSYWELKGISPVNMIKSHRQMFETIIEGKIFFTDCHTISSSFDERTHPYNFSFDYSKKAADYQITLGTVKSSFDPYIYYRFGDKIIMSTFRKTNVKTNTFIMSQFEEAFPLTQLIEYWRFETCNNLPLLKEILKNRSHLDYIPSKRIFLNKSLDIVEIEF